MHGKYLFINNRCNRKTVLGFGIVPPNNQGNATPFYNQGDNGENPAKPGVRTEDALDRYTKEAIAKLSNGYVSFAGQRDDGFYADIQAIFDLLNLRNPGKDSQGGFNIHLLALEIPFSELGDDRQIVGVYATTSRKQVRILRERDDLDFGRWVQVARQGNPLFNEGFVAVVVAHGVHAEGVGRLAAAPVLPVFPHGVFAVRLRSQTGKLFSLFTDRDLADGFSERDVPDRGGHMNIATTTDPLPIQIAPVDRLLTAAEFQKLADVPLEVEWFANLDNAHTRRA